MGAMGYVWGKELEVKSLENKASLLTEESVIKPILVCSLLFGATLVSESPTLSFQEHWSHTGQDCYGQPCSSLWPLSLPSPSLMASGP